MPAGYYENVLENAGSYVDRQYINYTVHQRRFCSAIFLSASEIPGRRPSFVHNNQPWLVGWLWAKHHVSAVDQVLTGALALFQAARERRCHVQRPGIGPGWLNLEARNLPLDHNDPP